MPAHTHSPAEWSAYAAVATAIYTGGAGLVILCAGHTRKQLHEAAVEIAHHIPAGRHRRTHTTPKEASR